MMITQIICNPGFKKDPPAINEIMVAAGHFFRGTTSV